MLFGVMSCAMFCGMVLRGVVLVLLFVLVLVLVLVQGVYHLRRGAGIGVRVDVGGARFVWAWAGAKLTVWYTFPRGLCLTRKFAEPTGQLRPSTLKLGHLPGPPPNITAPPPPFPGSPAPHMMIATAAAKLHNRAARPPPLPLLPFR